MQANSALHVFQRRIVLGLSVAGSEPERPTRGTVEALRVQCVAIPFLSSRAAKASVISLKASSMVSGLNSL